MKLRLAFWCHNYQLVKAKNYAIKWERWTEISFRLDSYQTHEKFK